MSSTDAEFDRFAVITIQGGGVYGLTLLGQLATVVYDLKVTPVALAGTSAGAIVATLYWAGLTPIQIRDHFADMANKSQLVSLVNPSSGTPDFDFAAFRALKNRFDGYLEQFEQGWQPTTENWFVRTVKWPFRTAGALWTAGKVKADVSPHVANRGLFTGEQLEKKIDELIRLAPKFQKYRNDLPQNRLLQFGDVRALTDKHADCVFPSLYLTATNVTQRRLELFNSVEDRYVNVPIARAVRASAGFPVFFRPVEVPQAPDGGWFVDGGLISNFPAWVFSHEFRQQLARSQDFRGLASRAWAHIGLRLGADSPDATEDPKSPQVFLKGLLGLLTGQARSQLEDRLSSFVPRSLTVTQPANETGGPENLLDVDRITGEVVGNMYDEGAKKAREQLGAIHFTLPPAETVESSLARLAAKALCALGQPNNDLAWLRSNVFIPSRQDLVLRYRFNIKGDPDEEMRFPFTSGLTGFCFTRRRPHICNLARVRDLAERGDLQPDELFGLSKEMHAQVRPDRTWLASVPIFDPQATYPRDLGRRPPGAALAVEGYHYRTLSAVVDGAVLGVLNLDAALSYTELGLHEDPAIHWCDVRIEAILNIMQSTALEVGRILSDAFASTGGSS